MNPLNKPIPPGSSVSMGPSVQHKSTSSQSLAPKSPIQTSVTSSNASKIDVAYEKRISDQRLKQLESDPKLFAGLTGAQRDLLEYYRYRVKNFDTERNDLIQKVSTLECTRDAYYQLKWELTKREEQIAELQKSLSDSHVMLYEERQQVLQLAAENDELRVQELEDRKRIQHLLALTQPVTQEVTYFKDCRPGMTTRGFAPIDKPDVKTTKRTESSSSSSSSSSGKTSKTSVQRPSTASTHATRGSSGSKSTGTSTGITMPKKTRSSGGGSGGSSVVRTIYMPNENVDVLRLIIQSLRTQLSEQKAFNDQRCQALVEDRIIRETEHSEMLHKLRVHIENLQKDLSQLMSTHSDTTKDYLNLRHDSVTREKELLEKLAMLSQQLHDTKQSLEKAKKEWAEKEKALRNEGEVFIDMFRKQALGSEEDLAIIRGQYDAAHKLYEKKIKSLEAKVSNLKYKLAQEENRRKLEMEGYQSDIRQCKDKLRMFERTISGMKMIDGNGVVSVPPKVIKLLAYNKDFNDIKTHLADIAHRLDKGHVV